MINSASASQQALSGDTWGIPGPDFLTCYLIAAGLAILTVLVIRRAATRGTTNVDAGALDPEQIGYLAGYQHRAFYTALTGRLTLGLVESSGPGTITAAGAPQFRLPALQEAILQAIGRGAATASARSDSRLTDPMTRLRDGLRSAGLLMTTEQTPVSAVGPAAPRARTRRTGPDRICT